MLRQIFGTLAPFGRIGRLLGWRWIMPIGTIPLPYNPWLARLLPALVGAAILWPVVSQGEWRWWTPLALWLALVVPLSLPVVQWAGFAFGLPLIQSLMPPVAMAMLVMAIATGQMAPAFVAVPIAYVTLHLGGAILGRALIARIAAADDRLEGMPSTEGGLPPMVLELPSRGYADIQTLMRDLGLRDLFVRHPNRIVERQIRLPAAVLAEVTDRAKLIGRIDRDRDGGARLILRDDLPDRAVVIRRVETSWIERRLIGHLSGWEVEHDGRTIRYLAGKAAPFGWYPGAMLFLSGWFAYGTRPSWTAGFVRSRARDVGTQRPDAAIACLVTAPLRDPDRGQPFDDPDAIRAAIDVRYAAMLADEIAMLDTIIVDPLSGRGMRFLALHQNRAALATRAETMARALESATIAAATRIGDPDQRLSFGIATIARGLALLPGDAFARLIPRLLATLAAPVLNAEGDRLRNAKGGITVRATEIPTHFVGCDLFISAPDLYERLGELGDQARPTIALLIERHGRVAPLVEAARRLRR